MKLFRYETEEEQLKAIKKDGNEIAYIHNPSEKVQLEAVKRNCRSIQYINNPSEEAQLEAVKHGTAMIAFIHNPTEKVIKYLLDNHSSNIDVMQILFARIGKEGYDKLSDEDKLRLELED